MIEYFFSQLSNSTITQFNKLDKLIDPNLHPEVIIINKGYFI
jgi:hypothetical protein